MPVYAASSCSLTVHPYFLNSFTRSFTSEVLSQRLLTLALPAFDLLLLNGAISRKMRPTKRSSAPKSANRTTVEWIQQRVSLIWYSMRVHSGASTSATAPRRPCSIESHGCGHSGEDWLQSDGCGFRGDVSTPRVACSRPRRRCRGGRSARPPPLMGARNEGCMWVLEKNATAADLGFRTWFTDCLYQPAASPNCGSFPLR